MTMTTKEAKIYIGNRILAHDKSEFLRAFDDLARQVTIDRLAELGENLTKRHSGTSYVEGKRSAAGWRTA